jgi:hypothetical protein
LRTLHPINIQIQRGINGRCRECYFHFKRTISRGRKSKRPADRINHGTCYEDKDGVVRCAEELLVCQIGLGGGVEQGVDRRETIDDGQQTFALLPLPLISLETMDEYPNGYEEHEDYGDGEDEEEEESKESSGEIMRYTVGKAWGALRRCWKAFKIAKNAAGGGDDIRMIKYARRIQRLERLLNIQANDFYGILPQQDLEQQVNEEKEDDRINYENRGNGEYIEDIILVHRGDVVLKKGVCYRPRNNNSSNNNNF